MKILQIITKTEFGGAQSVLVSLANKLAEQHEVVVAGGEGNGEMWKMLAPGIKQVKLKHLKRSVSLKDDFLAFIEFRHLYKAYCPDIIHLHSSKAGTLGRLAFPKEKIVYTVHGFDTVRLGHRQFLRTERHLQKRCSSIIGVSKYDRRWMEAEGITRNTTYIYNGVEQPRAATAPTLGIDSKRFKKTVLCVARMKPPKNLQLFMEIARLLPEYAFVWIGNEQKMEVPEPNVFFLGEKPNAGQYNAAADLFLLTSNYEGLPIVIIEAMSLGRPVVASNVGGISEIVVDGENGFALPNEAPLFAEKIKYILENNDVYDHFSKDARKKYEEQLTIDKMVNAYADIYAEIYSKQR